MHTPPAVRTHTWPPVDRPQANHAVSLAVIARAPVRNTELLLAAEGCEIVVRDLYEKLLHDVTRCVRDRV